MTEDSSYNNNKLTCIDLFAGAGGFSLAAKNSGIRVLAAVEYDKHASATYHKNFIYYKSKANRPKLYNQDILKLSPNAVMDDLNLKQGELDILMGGPPCQGFSSHRLKNAGIDDPRNKLLLRYFEYVKALLPKFFIVENVPGLLWPKHKKYLTKFKAEAKKFKYKIYGPTVINARDYGVPQNRRRVIIIGQRFDIDCDLQWPPTPTHFNPSSNEVQKDGKQIWLSAETVFEKSLDKNDINNIHMNPSASMIERFKNTPPNGGSREDSGFVLKCHGNGYCGHKDVYGRIDPQKPGPTMTTGCTNPSKGRFVHPTEHHGITARHAARFQTFPDNFCFVGGLGNAGKQIGNAVPIKLGERVLQTVCIRLNKE